MQDFLPAGQPLDFLGERVPFLLDGGGGGRVALLAERVQLPLDAAHLRGPLRLHVDKVHFGLDQRIVHLLAVLGQRCLLPQMLQTARGKEFVILRDLRLGPLGLLQELDALLQVVLLLVLHLLAGDCHVLRELGVGFEDGALDLGGVLRIFLHKLPVAHLVGQQPPLLREARNPLGGLRHRVPDCLDAPLGGVRYRLEDGKRAVKAVGSPFRGIQPADDLADDVGQQAEDGDNRRRAHSLEARRHALHLRDDGASLPGGRLERTGHPVEGRLVVADVAPELAALGVHLLQLLVQELYLRAEDVPLCHVLRGAELLVQHSHLPDEGVV